jgi:hypothetical protein
MEHSMSNGRHPQGASGLERSQAALTKCAVDHDHDTPGITRKLHWPTFGKETLQ